MNNLFISKNELLKNIDYKIIINNSFNSDLVDVIYDTRKVISNCAFVCIRGANFDTHNDIIDIIKKGATLIVINEDSNINIENLRKNIADKVLIIEVKNTRKALSIMSINYFRNPLKSIKIIGITGTKGKTTTAYMIKNILEAANLRTGIIGTIGCEFNNKKYKTDNTTPESYILQKYFYEMKNDNIEYVVMEVSSQSVKLNRIYGIAFDYGIFTNITPDHIGENEHKNFDEYFNCKLSFILNCNDIIINEDCDKFVDIKDFCMKHNKQFCKYSISNVKSYIYEDEKCLGTIFSYKSFNNHIVIPMPGIHNVSNAVSAITLTEHIGINEKKIITGLRNTKVNGRVDIAYKDNNYTVIIDYAYNEIGANALINSIKEYNKKRIVVVFGCGGNRDKKRRTGMGEAIGKLADFSIITADNSRYEKTIDIINQIVDSLKQWTSNYIIIEDRREVIKYAIENKQIGDIIYIIGKGHEDYNEVNGKKTYFNDKEEVLRIINNE